MSTTALTVHQQNVMAFRKMAESPAVLNRFKQVLDVRAGQFLASLTQLVSGSSYLAECDPNTTFAAALTSAALDLPIDKNLGFAHVVPYGKEAQFQMGYKGFIQLAIRTGQYRFLNCCEVHEGELVKYDKLTGEVVLDSTKRTSDKIVGYAAYFKLVNGYEHGEYWTREEVDAHAKQYSQAYRSGRNTPWKTNFDAMALKTVIKSLISHWGIMSIEMQKALTHDQGVRKSIDSDEVFYPDNDPKRPVQEGPTDIEATVTTDGPGGQGGEPTPGGEPGDGAAGQTQAQQPFEFVLSLAQRDGVTEEQVLGFLKAKKMCQPNLVELAQVSDPKLRDLAKTWTNVVGEIKKVQV